ncbi:MAG: amino acid ABC transporter permease [Alphaproteobacteria bacterium]
MAVDVKAGGSGTGGIRWWYDPKVRAFIFQAAFVLALAGVIVFIVLNTMQNLEKRGIKAGFDFLDNPAGFEIPLTLIPYSVEGGSTHGAVFVVGLLNTFLISIMGIVLATIIGFVLGVLRLSKNWLISRLVGVYIETIRNVPLLLQFLFWHFAVFQSLPLVRESFPILDTFYIHNRGLTGPNPVPESGFMYLVTSVFIAIAAIGYIKGWARKRQEATGQQFPVLWTALAILIGFPLLVSAILGFPLAWEYATLGRFRFTGGLEIPIELFSALAALTIYTSAFIAEIVRSGILAIAHGQSEAAHALGLRQGPTLRLVIIPQALRVIVPPLISQYLNLTKNSSLGIAIGYADLFNVFGGISLNQTGQALEIIAMCMLVYLTFSLLISLYMNWYNRQISLVER